MPIKAELVKAERASEVIERALKIRNPELSQARRKNAARARAKARKRGTPVPRVGWSPFKLNAGNRKLVERKPMEILGLSDLNRPISTARTEVYREEMQAGRWYFTPDPIVVSEEGYVINGQHRLCAADAVDWSAVAEIPQFLVVWGVDRRTALLMDEAKRSTTDRRHIALGFATAEERPHQEASAA
jgi:hypothetical protein